MATKTWAASSDGNYNVAGNWSPSGVPAAGDDIVFNATSTKNCTIDSYPNTVATITINSSYTGQITQNVDVSITGIFSSYGKWDMNDKNLTIGGAFVLYAGDFKGRSGTLQCNGSIDITNTSGIFTAGTGQVLHRPTGGNRNLSNPHSGNAFYKYILNDCCEMLQDFDETSSPSYDKSGFGRNGTWKNSLGASTTVPALKYPNSRSISSASASTAYDEFPGGSYHCSLPFSISIWMYATQAFSSGTGVLATASLWYDPWFSWALFGYSDSGNNYVTFQVPTSGWVGVVTPALNINQWYHICITVSSSGHMKLYLDGVLKSENDAATWHSWAYHTCFRDNWNFRGHLDGYSVYSKELSATEVSNLAAGKRGGISINTVTLQSNIKVTNECRLVAGTLAFGSYTLECAGAFNNYGAIITAGTGKLLLSGTSAQSVLSGSQSINNVEITNTSGAVSFEDACSIIGTLSANASSANIQIVFATSWEHAVATFNFNGASSYHVQIRSITSGVQHTIVGTNNGTQYYTDVKDSNLTVSIQNMTSATNTNSGNNSANWQFTIESWHLLAMKNEVYNTMNTQLR